MFLAVRIPTTTPIMITRMMITTTSATTIPTIVDTVMGASVVGCTPVDYVNVPFQLEINE